MGIESPLVSFYCGPQLVMPPVGGYLVGLPDQQLAHLRGQALSACQKRPPSPANGGSEPGPNPIARPSRLRFFSPSPAFPSSFNHKQGKLNRGRLDSRIFI